MKERQRRSIIVGVFVILGLFLFIVTIYLIGKKEYVFGNPYKISAIFNDVKGLQEGDKVRMSGIDIGTVSSMEFSASNQVIIQMNVDQEYFIYISKSSKIIIGSEGLMGAKVVKVLSGELPGIPVIEYDTLATIEQVEIDDIIQELNSATGNITIVTEELVGISQKINRGDGVFGKLFTDTTLTSNLDETIKNLSDITANFNDLAENVNQGKGVIGMLFADTTLSSDMNAAGGNIDQIATNLMEITDKINKGEGIFGKMFTDTSLTSNLYLTSLNLQSTAESLSGLAEKLNNDSSALHLFIDDPSFADSLETTIERLNEGIIEATEAAGAVQRSALIRLGGKKK